ncbi:hypothetical protein HMPREF9069_00194 [Atopobium sp. oral taxon 810 str. F0209]|nr:hypothetical protein HMPREF9069_00194 [Atopobium sp. oral taxon 810 str. F0209]
MSFSFNNFFKPILMDSKAFSRDSRITIRRKNTTVRTRLANGVHFVKTSVYSGSEL